MCVCVLCLAGKVRPGVSLVVLPDVYSQAGSKAPVEMNGASRFWVSTYAYSPLC